MQKALGWESGDTSLSPSQDKSNKQSDVNTNVNITKVNEVSSFLFNFL